jgi:DNA-binding NtrC family response regulator
MQQKDTFRKDLYYRLQTHYIHIPPLRERKEDIPLLLEHFLAKSAEQLSKKKPTPPRELTILLGTYHFPGNVRELESMVFDAVSRHQSGVLSMDSFRSKIGHDQTHQMTEPEAQEALPVAGEKQIGFPEQLPTLKEAERMLIAEALERADGNRTIAAQLLGLSRRALSNRLSRAQES